MFIKEWLSNDLCFTCTVLLFLEHSVETSQSPISPYIWPSRIDFLNFVLKFWRMGPRRAPHRHNFLLFPHGIHKQRQATDFVCAHKAILSCNCVWRIFQDNLSQYSKVLQQQEAVKVGRRPVDICCNYSLVMRVVSTEVWVTPFGLMLLH